MARGSRGWIETMGTAWALAAGIVLGGCGGDHDAPNGSTGGNGTVSNGGKGGIAGSAGRSGSSGRNDGSGGFGGGNGSGGSAGSGASSGSAGRSGGSGGMGGSGRTGGSAGSGGSSTVDPLPTGTPAANEVRINETIRLQTVDGMGADVYNFPIANDIGWDWASVNYVFDEVDIRYVRTAPWFVYWEAANDNADPLVANWDGFGTDNIPLWHDLPMATFLQGQGIEIAPGFWDVADWLAGGDPRTIAAANFPELAESITTYIVWLGQNGINIPVTEVQNEPTITASVQYPSPEALRDAALALLDMLDRHGLTNVMLHGPNLHAPSPTVEWARVWLQNDRLRARTAAVSYHTWWEDDFATYDGIRALAEEYGKPVWATEVGYCALATGCFDGANYLLPETWGTAWDYAMSHYRAFAWSHASRSYQWTLVGHDAAVSPTGERYPSLPIIKHFANYIPPGARMLEVASGDPDVLALAFLLPDSRVSAVLLNQGSSAKTLRLTPVPAAAWSPQAAITTTEAAWEAAATAAGPIGAGYVEVTLASQSVTSLRLVH